MASSSQHRYVDDMPRRDSIDDTPEGSGLLSQDPEKQSTSTSHSSQPHEDTVSTNKKLAYLAGYFICNIGLTLYNKAILGSVSPHHHLPKPPTHLIPPRIVTPPSPIKTKHN
jgi:hypothetical protein